jgi:hypothetical protein
MNILFPFILILLAAFSRLIPHAPNFTPIISLALFAGTYLQKKYAFVVPIAAMLMSDLLIGLYDPISMAFVYGSFLLIVTLGFMGRQKVSVARVAGLSFAGALLFFIVTNFGVWVVANSMYPKTLAGLIECYVMGIPFFRNTIISAFIYSAVLFGVYEAAEKFMLKTNEA